MPRYSLMLARFPGNNQEHPGSSGWLMDLLVKLKGDPRFDRIAPFRESDTPITMVRNRAVRQAMENNFDYLLMIDNDIIPDDPGSPGARPFFDTSWQFMQKLREPCAVAAPYCGPSPHNNIFVFQWANQVNEFREGEVNEYELAQFTREEAAKLGGIQEVAALPTGLILYDMRIFKDMPKPFFYYEWDCKEWQTGKSSTEDVAQTRDMSLAWYATGGKKGGRVFCNWDAWCIHVKPELVRKPILLPASTVGEHFKRVIERKNPDLLEKVLIRGTKPRFDAQRLAQSKAAEQTAHHDNGPTKKAVTDDEDVTNNKVVTSA